MQQGNNRAYVILLVLSIILLARIGFGYVLFNTVNGFTLFDGDSCQRVIYGWRWANQPTLMPPTTLWTHLHFWIYGLGLRIYPNAFIIPALINSIFAIGSLVVLFYLSNLLFPQYKVAGILNVGLAGFHPLYVWLSLSGLAESGYYFFVLSGIYLWIKYIKQRKTLFVLFSSLSFMLSSGLRFEGWLFCLIFSGLIIGEILDRSKKLKPKAALLSLMLLSWVFIVFWLILEKIKYGNPFNFLSSRQDKMKYETIWILGVNAFGVLRSFFDGIKRTFLSGGSILLSLIGIFAVNKRDKSIVHLLIFCLVGLIMLMAIFVLGVGGPWVERTVLIIPLLILPVLGFIICKSLSLIRFPQKYHMGVVCLIVCIFFVTNLVNGNYNPKRNLPVGPYSRKYARQCAVLLGSLYYGESLKSNERTLVEMVTTGSDLWAEVFMKVVNALSIKYDRHEAYKANEEGYYLDVVDNPSPLELSTGDLERYLAENNYKVVIAFSEQSKSKLGSFMDCVLDVGTYSFYLGRNEIILKKTLEKKFKKIKHRWYSQWRKSSEFNFRNGHVGIYDD